MGSDPVLYGNQQLGGGAMLRPIRREDDPAMARVIREVMTEFKAVGQGFSIEDPEVDHMTKAYVEPGHAYYVLDRGGRVLGGSGVGSLPGADGDICELKKMYVLGEGRGQGWGRALLQRCLDAAVRMGYRRCYLETLGTMSRARKLYETYGFAPISAPVGETGHHGCDRWYMRRLDALEPGGFREVEL